MYQLNDILSAPVALKVLRFFVDNPSKEFYRSEVTERLGIAKASAGKWLAVLDAEGLISCQSRANADFYRLNADNQFVKQLKLLLTLSRFLPAFKDFVDEAYLFGSAARGEDRENSDVDLLVLSSRDKRAVLREIAAIAEKSHAEIKPVIFSAIDYSMLARKDKPFYERVNKDRVKLSDAK